MEEKKLVVFIDSGDTIIDEGTEILDARGVVIHASVIPGADTMLRRLRDDGYRLCMTADGRTESFENVYRENGLWDVFSAHAISETVGAEKPDPRMFENAMRRCGLTDADKPRAVMVGNNLKRDILGANRYGITSILLDWSLRYDMIPSCAEETPKYVIHTPEELPALLDQLEEALRRGLC